MLKSLILILMGGVLINNYVLNQFLGICPFLGVSKKVNQATGMGVAVIFVMLFATAATWPIYNFLSRSNTSRRSYSFSLSPHSFSSLRSFSRDSFPRFTRRSVFISL